MTSLTKLQLPADEEVKRRVAEASELAEEGKMKEAQNLLKELVAAGALPRPTQRQIVERWSAGVYELEAPQKAAAGTVAVPGPGLPAGGPGETKEEQITRVMRRDQKSRKEATVFVDEGGLEMEEYQAEMDKENPMNAVFDKMKANGPPQWFVDMMNKKEAEGGEPAADGAGAEDAPSLDDMIMNKLMQEALPAGLPAALGPPPA
mmetsp:Transcript_49324/g.130374  ORF Transcript_49324/g.130374 Transcript_49324/m.130374 type:complete len:205 (-) Transcript_49324:8-622(-)